MYSEHTLPCLRRGGLAKEKQNNMLWSDFYDNYSEWAESTIRSRISSLNEIGDGDEVVE